MPKETIRSSLSVFCDGTLLHENGELDTSDGHPRVYLHIDQERGMIECPYCSHVFRYQGKSPLEE